MAGRPSKFKPEYVEQAAKLCALGATDMELADFFSVSHPTIEAWRKANPEFLASIKDSKDIADARVERRLFERAMGYEHAEVDIRVVNGEIVQTPIKKIYAPDVTAAIFWLKNRQSAKWRDLKAVELGNAPGERFLVGLLSEDGGLL